MWDIGGTKKKDLGKSGKEIWEQDCEVVKKCVQKNSSKIHVCINFFNLKLNKNTCIRSFFLIKGDISIY